MSEKLVYLAGPITGLTYEECTEWRQKAYEELCKAGITAISPMRHKGYIKTALKDNPIPSIVNLPNILSRSKGIKARDKNDVRRSNALLVNLLGAKRVSTGTCFELAWADEMNIPTIVCMEENNIHHNPILDECCDFIVPTIEEGIEIVKCVLSTGT